jgi:signal transduction histidine kinase
MSINKSPSRKSHTPTLAERRTSAKQYSKQITLEAKPQKQSLGNDGPENTNEGVIAVAHDLNNLIAATAGFATLIISRPEHDSQQYAERIIAASRMAGLLVERLIQTSGRPQKIQRTSIPNAIKEIAALVELKTDIQAKISIEYDKSIEEYDIDLTDLTQLVLNLTMNARYALHTNKIDPELQIRFHKAEGEFLTRRPDFGSLNSSEKYLCLEVSDNGSGMEEATRQKALNPYFTTKGELGTGIGLVIVSNIVRRYNGAIFIDSEKGRGTRFSILWPTPSPGSTQISRHP